MTEREYIDVSDRARLSCAIAALSEICVKNSDPKIQDHISKANTQLWNAREYLYTKNTIEQDKDDSN